VKRPQVVIHRSNTHVGDAGLTDVPDQPHDLSGILVRGVIRTSLEARVALDVALRGADLVLCVDLPEAERNEFLDQLGRVADMVEGEASREDDEYSSLVEHLRRGATLREAAKSAGVSHRTAARRLKVLRDHHGVRTVAELLALAD